MEPQTLIAQYQIEPYRGSHEKLRQLAVGFVGAPRTAQTPGKVLLLNDPASHHGFCYEFRTEDIVYVEEAPSLALPDGTTAAMVRVWVRKGVTALKIEAFHVQDISAGLSQYFGD